MGGAYLGFAAIEAVADFFSCGFTLATTLTFGGLADFCKRAAGIVFVALMEAALTGCFVVAFAGLLDRLLDRLGALAITWLASALAGAWLLDLDDALGAGMDIVLDGEFADFLICLVFISCAFIFLFIINQNSIINYAIKLYLARNT